MPEGAEQEFAKLFCACYEARMGTLNAAWNEKIAYIAPLFALFGARWQKVSIARVYYVVCLGA